MRSYRTALRAPWSIVASVVALILCGCQGEAPTDFVSADLADGQASAYRLLGVDLLAPTAMEDTSGSATDRSVEEGDIYRVLSGDLILNLNAYRGLQVIDIRDVEDPQIIGGHRVSGSPVELYAVGDVAFVLLNNWRGYYGIRGEIPVEAHEGGLVLSLDLSDPTEPRVVDRAVVPGYIKTSRLTRGGGQAALYVVTGGWDHWENEDGSTIWESRTIVASFDVSTGALEKRTQLNLGGYVADIQATPAALLVARNEWSSSLDRYQSRVSIIGIGDPTGFMVEGDEVQVEGRVASQFNMDLYRGVLRVVSSDTSVARTNILQTFDASDIQRLEPIDRVSFGDGQQLFATLFVGNKAFFVTYLRIDPLHAFEIDDRGFAREVSEFEVSGWNDFFRPVFDERRLVGIGVDDQDGFAAAVSLYDIEDLANPEPLLVRAEVEGSSGWSEARWDHRAFSVLEDAVEVAGPDGAVETGLVLLPFSGWSQERDSYVSAVQILTFSGDTLTRRGVMDHGTPVRRSFIAADSTTANLSEIELSLFDTGVPDDPVELGRVELAPNYTDFFVYGDYGARLEDTREYYSYWWGGRSELPPAAVEIVPRALHPDLAEPVARFEIPAQATVYQVGDLLVTVDMRMLDSSEWPYTYETEIVVYDLGDPTSPRRVGTLTTDRLRPGYSGYPWLARCLGCDVRLAQDIAPYPYYGGTPDVAIVEGALVFVERRSKQLPAVSQETCSTSSDGTLYCTPLPPTRYWQQFALQVLDLTTPAEPVLADPVELPERDEGVGFLADGSDLWVSFKRPEELEEVGGEERPHARYFIRRVDLLDPSSPRVDDEINVPGELLAVEGDTIFTRDLQWGDGIVESAVARLELDDGLAYLQAERVFPDEQVASILLDDRGHIVVSSRRVFAVDAGLPISRRQQLSVLDAYSDDLALLAQVDVETWAGLRDVVAGRVLFQVPGGLLVFNLDDPASPYPQAFFATWGWPRQILVDGGEIIVPAGRYGIYAFDLDEFNLLERLSEAVLPPPPDTDEDGVPDRDDNCLELANGLQVDTDADGFGNACDADYDNSGSVDGLDLLLHLLGSRCEEGESCFSTAFDHDGDGAIGIRDLYALVDALGGAPGPSGLLCAGRIPCAAH